MISTPQELYSEMSHYTQCWLEQKLDINSFWKKKRLKREYLGNQTSKNLEKMFFLIYIKRGMDWYRCELLIAINYFWYAKVCLGIFSAKSQI